MPVTQASHHRTPLKRVSQGSLFALSRSGAYHDAPHGLGFLAPAMAEFLDEAEALQANAEGMKNLSDTLATFNESFASWLYVMDMNALTTDWLQAPTNSSFLIARRRAEEDASKAVEASRTEAEIAAANKTTATELAEETTFTGNVTTTSNSQISKSAAVQRKRVGKPKLSAKEKKERNFEIEKIISCLPLEFRGSDPGLHRSMENIITKFLDAAARGLKLTDLIQPPDLAQARVNKCLIALVNRKVVRKDNSTGTVLYYWQGVP